MVMECPPGDPPATVDLMQQMDSLCHDLVVLRELVKARRRRNAGPPAPAASQGFGDFAPRPRAPPSPYPRVSESIKYLMDTPSVPPTIGSALGLGNWWPDFSDPSFRSKFHSTISGILKWGFRILYFLLFISCLLALFVDQDLIDPYIGKCIKGGTLTERLVTGIRDNWQVPFQREFRCVSNIFPIYKSRRNRFWEVLYSTIFQSHKECDPEKSYILKTLRYLSCVGATPRPSWGSDPCRR